MKKLYSLPFVILLCLYYGQANAQSTFSQVRNLLQANCAGSGCHGAGAPTFDVTASESDLYNALVNVNPSNPAAAAKGNKRVTPGYVDRSFLLRKMAHGLPETNPHLALTQPQEGAPMPDGLPALAAKDIELVRQWILFGAPLTGTVIDTAVINTYYSGKGIDDTYDAHTPPAPGEGFQIYVGKIFIPKQTEIYYYIKHDLRNDTAIEIPKINTMMPSGTHHFIMYKFQPNASGIYAPGLRPEAESSHASVLDGIGTGPNLWQYDLPANSAYFWEPNTVLDLNLHIFNPKVDTVLAADLYINVYTEAVGTAQNFMRIMNFPVFSIAIPPDGQEHEFVEVANDTTATKMWKVWQLYGHTHQWGTDYDIFQRNPDGSMGQQEYESWMSYEQGFNVGYHRFGVDATFRFYPDDSLLQIDPRIGFIHRARYRNNTQDTIFWGLTSMEEMMVMGFQYIEGDELGPLQTGIGSQPETIKLKVFPNPASDAVTLNYILEHTADVKVELTNTLGESVILMEHKNEPAGNYLDDIELDQKLAPGMYLLTLRSGNSVTTRRLVIE